MPIEEKPLKLTQRALEPKESVPPDDAEQEQGPQPWYLWMAYAAALVVALIYGVFNPGALIFLVAALFFGIGYACLAWCFGWKRMRALTFVDKVLEYIFVDRRYGG